MTNQPFRVGALVRRGASAIGPVLRDAAQVISQAWRAHVRRMSTDGVYRRIVTESLLVIVTQVSPVPLIAAVLAALIALYLASQSDAHPEDGNDDHWPGDGHWG